MLRFISFGSGSSGNCYYLFTENDGILIDLGVGVRDLKKHFREYGLSLSKVKHILITHDHADHVKSVGSVSRYFSLQVFSTHQVHVGINENKCVKNKIAPDLVRIIEKGKTFQLGDFTITSFGVPHDSFDNVGYLIEAEGVVFCLMTDVGHLTDKMREMIGRANYLVIEANYDEEMLKRGPYPEHLKGRIKSDEGHMENSKCAIAIAENEGDLFPEECLLVDNIKLATNQKIATLYKEFKEKRDEAMGNLETLQKMFLLDEVAINKVRKTLKTSDSDN